MKHTKLYSVHPGMPRISHDCWPLNFFQNKVQLKCKIEKMAKLSNEKNKHFTHMQLMLSSLTRRWSEDERTSYKNTQQGREYHDCVTGFK